MKRVISILMMVVLCFGLVGCGGNQTSFGGIKSSDNKTITLGMNKSKVNKVLGNDGIKDERVRHLDRYDYGNGIAIAYRDDKVCVIHYDSTDNPSSIEWKTLNDIGIYNSFEDVAVAYNMDDEFREKFSGTSRFIIYYDENKTFGSIDKWQESIGFDIDFGSKTVTGYTISDYENDRNMK